MASDPPLWAPASGGGEYITRTLSEQEHTLRPAALL
jgi:hypothetical protein